MIVTAWGNGQHNPSGAGYGIKIAPSDRDRFFDKEWDFVLVEIEESGVTAKVNIGKPSFWGSGCRELIHQAIGKWFLAVTLAP